MVPPGDLFSVIPVWVGVYLVAVVAFGVHSWVLYRRVFGLTGLGKPSYPLEQPFKRLLGALVIVIGQRKVLQSVTVRYGDLAGIGHSLIFYGFISMVTGYLVLIFADSAWRSFSKTVLTSAGLKVFIYYLEVVALVILAALAWALIRRWVVRPHRLSFDLTRHYDAVVIVGLIAALMITAFLTEGFFVAAGGTGPEASAPVGGALGRGFRSLGLGSDAANTLQGVFWWLHYLIIMGFAVYIPFSKHMHMIASPVNAFARRLKPQGTLEPVKDLEQAERFGAGRIQDFTWKELL
ncbi:MAG: hypothetical protein HYY31_05350, partial [Chloroflexi bacterium]|nr:hypothetical protein [Chloroflexota bacterium]